MSRHPWRGTLRVALGVLIMVSAAATSVGVLSAGSAEAGAGSKLAITTAGLPNAIQGTSYAARLQIAGEVGEVHWSLTSGSLPVGLGLASDGQISGTPTGTTTSFTVNASDSSTPVPQMASKSLSIAVASAPKLVITGNPVIDATQGQNVQSALSASGGTVPYNWSLVGGTLPAGMSVAPDGTISGIPTTSGSQTFEVEVTDSAVPTPQTATEQVTVSVEPAIPLAITSSTLPSGNVDEEYQMSLVAIGGVQPDTWTIQSGTLPPGLNLSASGEISGTPTQAGTSSFVVKAQDSATPTSSSALQSLTLNIGPEGALSVSTSGSDAAVQARYFQWTLSASGGTAPYTWSITSGSLPPGLSLDATNGYINGSPSTPGLFNFTLEATDSATTPDVATEPLSIEVQPAPPLAITTTGPLSGTQGSYYDSSLTAIGGVSPYTWSIVSGSLPAGLALDSYGDLYGTPTGSGSSNFTVEVTDSATPSPDVSILGLSMSVAQAPPFAITTGGIAAAIQGQRYDMSFATTGGVGAVTWSVSTGSLPLGLSLDPSGQLYGEPTVSGSYPFTIEARDSATPVPNVATDPIDLSVSAAGPLSASATDLPPAMQGQNYDQYLSATGGTAPYTWTLVSGSLPANMFLAYGQVYGLPTDSGTFTFRVEVTDSSYPTPEAVEQSLTLVVNSAATLSVSSNPLPIAQAGQNYSTLLTASGGVGVDTWSITSGSLPSGVSLNWDGTLSGEPTSAGTFTFSALVTDEATPMPDTVTASFSLTVDVAAQLSITSNTLPSAIQFSSYDTELESSGGVGPFVWALASGSLPVGLSFTSNGELSGDPTAAGTYMFTVTETDSATPTADTVTSQLSLTVVPAGTFSVLTSTLPNASVGQTYSSYLSSAGGTGTTTWSLTSGSMPQGLTLDPYGDIYGVPTEVGAFTFSVSVTDSATPTPDIATMQLTINVGPAVPLSIAAVNLPSASEGYQYYGYLEATGGVGADTWSLQSGSLPAGLALTSDGEIGGEPKASGSFTVTVQVTDSATPIPDTVSESLTLIVDAGAQVTITTSSLGPGTEGQYYLSPLSAIGGVSPYTWSILSGSLPAGLSMSSGGVLSGNPTETGTFPLTIEASGADGQGAAQTFSLDIAGSTPVSITTRSLPPGAEGTYYHDALAAAGGVGPYTWSVPSGSLPAGLDLSATGELSGAPTVAGTYAITVEATDSGTPIPQTAIATLAITLTGGSPFSVATTELRSGVVDEIYDEELGATAGVFPYTWSVSSGLLPSGVTLDPSGELTGKPTTAGTFTFVVEATDSGTPTHVATESLTLTILPETPLSIIAMSMYAQIGQSYFSSFNASGGDGVYTWSVASGSLPSGLTLNAEGDIEGEPTVDGSFTFTVEVTDSATPTPDTATESVALTVYPASQLAAGSFLPAATQGQSYGGYLYASGGFSPYTWSVSSGSLPPGLTLDSQGDISGNPTSFGSFTFTAGVTDSATPTPGTASELVTLVVAPPPPLVAQSSVSGAVQGQYYGGFGDLYTSGGFSPYTWSVSSGSLPPGISLDAEGDLYGYPTVSGSFTFTAEVTDSAAPTPDTATESIALTVAPPAPLVAESSVPAAAQGQYYDGILDASGGIAPYTWSIASGSLPPEMSLDAEGDLYGVPTVAGTFTFTAEVTDSATPTPDTATESVAFTVEPPTPLVAEAYVPAATQGQGYDGYLYASGGFAPYTWSVVSGSLPAGLVFDAQGDLYGDPTATGSVTFTAEVTDSATPTPNTATESVTVTVSPPTPLVAEAYAPAATQGQSYEGSLYASGGFAPYTWSVSSGSLPPGLTLDAQGDISGDPTSSGSFTFTAEVTDSATPTPNTATESVGVTVAPAASLVAEAFTPAATQGQRLQRVSVCLRRIHPLHLVGIVRIASSRSDPRRAGRHLW